MVEGPSEDSLVFPKLLSDRSRELMRRIFGLVEEASGRIGDRHDPALSMLLEAATLLRQQIPSAEGVVGARGCLVNWQARRVRDYIDSHIAGPILVADLCAIAQRSEAHFSRAFKRTFGESPHAFVMRRRVELAARYMLTTNGSLSDIALRCGFTDQAHMGNQFREAVGETPGAWRRARKWQHANASQQAREQVGISWRARVPLRLRERDEGENGRTSPRGSVDKPGVVAGAILPSRDKTDKEAADVKILAVALPLPPIASRPCNR